MKFVQFIQRWLCLWILCVLSSSVEAASEQNIYQGPLLQITVERGDQKLPIGLVNHLIKGDRLWVQPQTNSLAQGDWIVLLATISPSGNHIQTQRFNLSDSKTQPMIELTQDSQSPIILLAPQVRNMFGLYTSFNESSDLLRDAVTGDPQLFLQLQKLDLVNQAIAALRDDLDQTLKGKTTDQAIAATQALASSFGVKTIDPECFKNNVINTPCVALSMVTNRDFVIPNSSDLSSVMGQQKADDLTSYLTSSLHVISAASDFLTNKFRDQYDFAPSFGRQQDDASMVRLFALSRFRNGDVKTVYVYTPAWFLAPMPELNWSNSPSSTCLFRWQLFAQHRGRLPVLNYWHDWEMIVKDPLTQQTLMQTQDLRFKPGLGVLEIGPLAQKALLTLTNTSALIELHASFGFESLQWPAFRVALPEQQNVAQLLNGLNTLISREHANLVGKSTSSTACLEGLQLQTEQGVTLTASNAQPSVWTLDLSQTPPSTAASLIIQQSGIKAQSLPVRIQQPKAQISAIEHANLDTQLIVRGHQLDRIEAITWGQTRCTQQSGDAQSSVFACDHDIRLNSTLPDQVTVTHRDQEPASQNWRLLKTKASPNVALSTSSPNALLIQPSPTALQWGLGPRDNLLSQDSGLMLLLQTQSGYALESGIYHLELKLQDDPQTAQTPLTAALITDMAHNELRTRNPVFFNHTKLPSVINPVFWRVVQDASSLSSPWQPVNKSVLLLPQLATWSCAGVPGQILLHGQHLDLIDNVAFDTSTMTPALAVDCADGLCLQLQSPRANSALSVELHWLKEHPFTVKMPAPPECKSQSAQP